MSSPLRMVRLELRLPQLMKLGRQTKGFLQGDDVGHLVHSALAGLFGQQAVQPFRCLSTNGQTLPVLGYTEKTRPHLINHARSFAQPEYYEACDWDSLAIKPMPDSWSSGRVYSFEVRACPVARLASERRTKFGTLKKGAEVDLWLHRRWIREEDPNQNRLQVYTDWLERQISGAATASEVQLHAFRRTKMVRRTHTSPRSGTVLERPDVLLRGVFNVQDGRRFGELLENGIGRHKAFGFGMLLLKSPITRLESC